MIQIIFRIIGGLILFLGAGVLFAGILVATGHSLHLSAVSPLMFCIRLSSVVLLHAVIGIGLLLLRKWAALALSILALYAAWWSLLAAIHPVNSGSGDWNWVGYVWAALLVIPLILTVKYWNSLVWRRKAV